MIPTPKTIQIYLPSGDPSGIRIAEITTRIVQVFDVPRNLLQDFLQMPESDQVALYFLFGTLDETSNQRVYIGQTGDLRNRLSNHNRDREFWQRVVVLVSKTNSLTQTHALSLEWYSIQEARKAERYADENSNGGSKPHTPAPLEADCMEIYATGKILLASLGFPIFDPVVNSSTTDPKDVLFCKGSGCDGRGEYTNDGFVVFKGSIGRKESVRSIADTAAHQFREKLIETGVTRVEGDRIIFETNYLFNSPSAAATALMGRTASGWDEWKNSEGKTLDELKRRSLERKP